LIHVYRPDDHRDVAGCPILKSIDYNEAWDRKAVMREILQHDIRLVIFHHANDLQAFLGNDRLTRDRHLVHIPHGAERTIFAPAAHSWEGRSIPTLLTGALRPDVYPLRARCADLIRCGQLPGEIRAHPGYRTTDGAATRDQFVDYAQHLGRSRIALVLGITYNYALAKYPEAAMAGCLLAGDVPDELVPTLGQHMVRLHPEMSDAQIVQTVTWWLEHETEARQRAAASQQLALTRFTMEHYADRFVQVAQEFLTTEAQRQHQLPGPRRLRARSQAVAAWLAHSLRLAPRP
jgi:hypothetical protein